MKLQLLNRICMEFRKFFKQPSLNILAIVPLILALQSCSPKDRPSNSIAIDAVLEGQVRKSPEVVYSRKINLDAMPDFEVVYLIRNGSEEILSVFKNEPEKGWICIWKKSFSLLNVGPIDYDQTQNKWIPSKDSNSNDGYIVKNLLAVELAGDNFNSLFFELMSEEPPLGLFSVPMAYRDGKKVLDGLIIFKDHPKVKSSKRVDFNYKKEDKSIQVFPKDRNSTLEFVFNGYEMILNLNSQPIPSLISGKREGNRVRLEFKNRGGYTSVTYLTFSFPGAKRVKAISETGLRAYQKSDSIFSITKGNPIPAIYPLVEATKEGWGANVRYAIEFELELDEKDRQSSDAKAISSESQTSVPIEALFRVSYKWNRNTETIPNSYSVVPYEMDQQGYPAYKLLIP